MESRLIFRHHPKPFIQRMTQVAKVGEAVSWLLQAQTPFEEKKSAVQIKAKFDRKR
jgi:hypothetical protein